MILRLKFRQASRRQKIFAWCDGSCNNKTKQNGGIGIVILAKGFRKEISDGSYINTTSARMEILAAIRTMQEVKDKSSSLHIYCDNQYVVNSIMKGWVFNWESQGFVSRINSDMWKLFLTEFRKFIAHKGNVEMFWVKGHNGNKENEIADELAGLGAKKENKITDI